MNILMVLTSHDQLGNTGRKTGFWLEELAAPYFTFKDAGHRVVLASPKGGKPPLDPKSNEPEFKTDLTRRFEADPEAMAQLASTVPLASVRQEDFDTVFYPGGHGPMWDLPENQDSIRLIESFAAAGKPVALVCHAPAALRRVRTPEGRPFVEGKKVTGFTNGEEAAVGLTNVVPFLVEDELKALGGLYSKGPDWSSYVLDDGLLVTGQNPASSKAAAERLLQTMGQRGQAQAAPASGEQFRITRVTPAYWRVTIDHPPFNIFGPESTPMLNSVITQIEKDPQLKVVVFDSAVPGFFLTHYDFVPPLDVTTRMPNGPTGFPPLPDMLVRLSKSPVVSIVSIRGRATGVGSELSLAADMRFASREKAVLSQFEIGAGFVPGGGPMARLPRLVGRGRALEILLSGNDIDGELAERYGYVNRAFPDAELDRFVDDLARRISTFDKQSLGEIKNLVNAASLPPDKDVGAEWSAFIASVQRPAAQHHIKRLMELGLQKEPDVEIHLDKYTGQVNQSGK